jgi:hypothetical protein
MLSIHGTRARLGAWLAVLALAACRGEVPPVTPAASSPLAVASPPIFAVAAPEVVPRAPALPSTDLPPGPIYFCVVGAARSPIEFEPRVEALCRRHPEMGPCQYERNACRARGGRVFTSKDEEVTLAVEKAYDARVLRVRI